MVHDVLTTETLNYNVAHEYVAYTASNDSCLRNITYANVKKIRASFSLQV